MKLSVIIVNYNVKHYLWQCLDSVRKALNGIDAEVYVVDNHSKDGSVEYLKPHFPEVRFIESNHNLGFARANNRAIKQCSGEYVLLLNPDTIVGEDTLKRVLCFLEQHPKAGGVGVKMLKSNGEKAMESRRGIPTPMVAFYKMCGLCERFPLSKRFARYYMSYLPWESPAQIEVVSGAFCMLRKETLDKVGLLDENFFMYGEDIDLSYRVLQGGYENWYVPETILHYKGESTEKSSFKYVHVFYKAMFIFFKKHYKNAYQWITWPIQTAIFFKALVVLMRVQTNNIRKMLGFSAQRWHRDPDYIFIVHPSVLEECKMLATKKGISFVLKELNQELLEKGHHAFMSQLSDGREKFIVYDKSVFDYKTILSFFAKNPLKKIKMAIYHPEIKTLITDEEIIR
ncbi:MAG: glycosyltransferase family 2 protein [Prevotella sp.]|nr:glycosyltransferase family 2 protein [Prevotella sp.]